MKRTSLLMIVPLLVLAVISMVACGIPTEEYDNVVAELDAVQNELESAQVELEEEVESVAAERDASQADLDELKAKLDKLIVAGDTVRGHIPSTFGPLCAVNSQWHPGELMVWRFRIWDPETGNELPAPTEELIVSLPDADELASLTEGLTATVHLSDGQEFPAHFGGHGGVDEQKADYFWTTSWEIPVDHPTGVLEDWITVEWTDSNKTGISQPFKVSFSMITILEEINVVEE